MATEHMYKVLFFMQSTAFLLFIINYSGTPNVRPQPVVTDMEKLGEANTKKCDCKAAASVTREVFNQSAYFSESGDPPRLVHGSVSNCTLADILRRPGVVLLTTANLAYADVALNMLESIKRSGVCVNTTIIAEDQKAYDLLRRYTKGDPAITVQKTNSGEMDEIEPPRGRRSRYYGIMNKRQAYYLTLLEQGVEVLFSDADTFWFRDPFPYFQGDFDMCLRGWDKTRIISKSKFCAGFIYLKPTNATIQFVRAWVDALGNDKKGRFSADQTVMNGLLRGDKPVHVNINILEEDLFPWGPTFFDPSWQKQNHSTVVMHAASISGHPAKLSKFKQFGMWLVNVTTSTNT